jgi:type VI protein secretion system component Hcp
MKDVYIKFGVVDNDADLSGFPEGTELDRVPDIEGDSTDSNHWWWCELRECGFDLTSPQQTDNEAEDDASNQGSQTTKLANDGNDDGEEDAKKVPAKFKPVTIKKRIDWASSQLFEQYVYAALKQIDKPIITKGIPETGIIEQVTVEVCRPAGGKKIAVAIADYYGVKITGFHFSIDGPEPEETVTFEFDKVQYTYVQTSPYTGEVMDSKGKNTVELPNHHDKEPSSGNGASSGEEDTSENAEPGGGSPTPATAPVNVGGSPLAPGTAPDPTVTVNFPGLWQGTGFGILPD